MSFVVALHFDLSTYGPTYLKEKLFSVRAMALREILPFQRHAPRTQVPWILFLESVVYYQADCQINDVLEDQQFGGTSQFNFDQKCGIHAGIICRHPFQILLGILSNGIAVQKDSSINPIEIDS